MHPIELKPSRLMGLLLGGMTLLALSALYLAVLPVVVHGLLGLAVVLIAARAWQRSRVPEVLRIAADGGLQCRNEQAEWKEIEILGDSLVTRYMIVLRYRVPGTRVQTRVLMADSAAADELRRLRVSLRWARHTRSDTTSPDAG